MPLTKAIAAANKADYPSSADVQIQRTGIDSDGAAPPPSPAPSHFRFLDLPGELRNLIYEYIAVKDQPIEITAHHPDWSKYDSKHLDQSQRERSQGLKKPVLALVSRKLSNEVLHIFYSRNTFTVTSVKAWSGGPDPFDLEKLACEWIMGLSESNQKSLGKVIICSNMQAKFMCLRWNYSWCYTLAEDRIWKGKTQRGFPDLRDKDLLKGWCWYGDVENVGGCDHSRAEFLEPGRKSCTHHALMRIE